MRRRNLPNSDGCTFWFPLLRSFVALLHIFVQVLLHLFDRVASAKMQTTTACESRTTSWHSLYVTETPLCCCSFRPLKASQTSENVASNNRAHFEVRKPFNALKDNNEWSLESSILKSGDMSRPFGLDQWCNVLCEELIRQGVVWSTHHG